MSLCISALTPSGIILTADSRTTYRNITGMARIGTENATKLFRLSDRVGALIAGRAFFPDSSGGLKSAGWFIGRIRKERNAACRGWLG